MMAGAYPGFGQMNTAAYVGNGYQQPIYIPQGQVNQGYAWKRRNDAKSLCNEDLKLFLEF